MFSVIFAMGIFIRAAFVGNGENNLGFYRQSLARRQVWTPLTGERADPLKYLPAVYGIVQSDEAYKRIHNYASSETMYKNLSAAVLFGGLIEILYLIHTVQATWSCGIIAVWLLSVALLMHRYYRFKIKKYAYSLIWFIEKYQSTTVVNEQ